MDPEYSLQDLVRCHICETPGPSLHCDICDKHLCRDCEEKHLSEESKEHKVVPFNLRGSTTKCLEHSSKICERYCEQCNIPICVLCLFSRVHRGHVFVDLIKKLQSQKNVLQRDLQELEKSIYPKYKELSISIPSLKADIMKNSQELMATINKNGEDLHREVDIIIEKLKSDLNNVNSGIYTELKKQEDEIANKISKITQCIAEVNELLNSNEARIVLSYKSRNSDLKRLPPKLTTLPSFTPLRINIEQFFKQFSFLPSLLSKTNEHDYKMDVAGAEAFPSDKQFIDEPRIIIDINTRYRELYNVSCQNDEEIWTSGEDKIICLYNLQGELVKSIQTTSGKRPDDIAVTKSGDLVYTDYDDRTVNILKNTQIQEVIRFEKWRPYGVCISFSGDIFVIIDSCDRKQTKVVRFSGTTEIQSFQYDEKGNSLYSSGYYSKYISENRNLDICVSDFGACAVVVVNKAGRFRFRYTGFRFSPKESFRPYGITTDSQGRILAADGYNHRIHILDQDGQFLRYIDNCSLGVPFGLCVDVNDNLFVDEWNTGRVKKIQYYK